MKLRNPEGVTSNVLNAGQSVPSEGRAALSVSSLSVGQADTWNHNLLCLSDKQLAAAFNEADLHR